MSNSKFVSFFVFLNCFLPINSQDCKDKIIIGERHKIYSSIYNKERKITIGLPHNYDPKKKYPVLYMLDGLAQFSISTAYSGMNYVGVIPDLIIVAIDYENRNNEYTPTHIEKYQDSGGSEQFIEFMDKDLFPYIDSVYSTMPYRIITGHSFAGILVVDLMTSKPNLFNAYIAMDPSLNWDNYYEFNKLVDYQKNENLNYKCIYMSGTKGNESKVTAYDSILNSKNIPLLRHTYQIFEDEGHANSVFLSLYYGLRYIFSDYSVTDAQRNPIELAKNPEFIKTHYTNFSKQVGVQFLPPEDLYIRSARRALYDNENKDVQNAFMILEILKNYYPESDNIFECLGEAYLINGDNESALENYKKSLKLNPSNKKVKNKISELEK